MSEPCLKLLEKYGNIGFDLDGTLLRQSEYDARIFSLYLQRYKSIEDATLIGQKIADYKHEKGYGAPHVLDDFVIENPQMVFNVAEMLEFYREGHAVDLQGMCSFERELSNLSETGKNLFLVTNGRRSVQSAKINSLAIAHYFRYIVILDPFENAPLKPSVESRKMYDLQACRTVYLGDQKIDEEYAKNCNYDFIKVTL